MLKTDMKEARTGVLEITDMKERTVEKLLEFIYSGEIEDMGDQLESVFKAAEYYEVMDLVCFWCFLDDMYSHDRFYPV